MGSSGSAPPPPQTQIIQSPRPENIPLEAQLIPQAENMLESAHPWSQFGAGFNLAPRAPFGQVYTPGPNQTLFGDPYNPSNYTPNFGPSAVPQQQAQSRFNNPNLFGQGGQGSHLQALGQILGPLFGFSPGSNMGQQPRPQGGGQQGGQQQQQQQGGQPLQPNYSPPPQRQLQQEFPYGVRQDNMQSSQPQQNNFAVGPIAPFVSAPNAPQQQQPQQPQRPPDPWAGTPNAYTGPGTGLNWNPDGTWNQNGPYTPVSQGGGR